MTSNLEKRLAHHGMRLKGGYRTRHSDTAAKPPASGTREAQRAAKGLAKRKPTVQ